MKKWRIKEVTYRAGTPNESKKYLVEKRFLGFLWWHDPFEDGMYSDGEFNTFDEALKRVQNHITYTKSSKIVWEV